MVKFCPSDTVANEGNANLSHVLLVHWIWHDVPITPSRREQEAFPRIAALRFEPLDPDTLFPRLNRALSDASISGGSITFDRSSPAKMPCRHKGTHFVVCDQFPCTVLVIGPS